MTKDSSMVTGKFSPDAGWWRWSARLLSEAPPSERRNSCGYSESCRSQCDDAIEVVA